MLKKEEIMHKYRLADWQLEDREKDYLKSKRPFWMIPMVLLIVFYLFPLFFHIWGWVGIGIALLLAIIIKIATDDSRTTVERIADDVHSIAKGYDPDTGEAFAFLFIALIVAIPLLLVLYGLFYVDWRLIRAIGNQFITLFPWFFLIIGISIFALIAFAGKKDNLSQETSVKYFILHTVLVAVLFVGLLYVKRYINIELILENPFKIYF